MMVGSSKFVVVVVFLSKIFDFLMIFWMAEKMAHNSNLFLCASKFIFLIFL